MWLVHLPLVWLTQPCNNSFMVINCIILRNIHIFNSKLLGTLNIYWEFSQQYFHTEIHCCIADDWWYYHITLYSSYFLHNNGCTFLFLVWERTCIICRFGTLADISIWQVNLPEFCSEWRARHREKKIKQDIDQWRNAEAGEERHLVDSSSSKWDIPASFTETICQHVKKPRKTAHDVLAPAKPTTFIRMPLIYAA